MTQVTAITTFTLATGQAVNFAVGGRGTANVICGPKNQTYTVGLQECFLGPFDRTATITVTPEIGTITYGIDGDGVINSPGVLQLTPSGLTKGGVALTDAEKAGFLVGVGSTFTSQSHTFRLKSALNDAQSNLSILVVGDSTGNGPDEWVDLMCAWIASVWPAYTVRRYLWDNVSKSYSSPVDFNVGASAFVLSVWNCSVAGSKVDENLGASFSSAFVDKAVDLLIVNHGFNYQTGIPYGGLLGAYAAGVESILREYPSAGVVMFAQPPRRLDELQSINVRAVMEYSAIRGFDVADVYSDFIKNGRPVSWYLADNLHPSSEGSTRYLEALKPLFNSGAPKQISGSCFDRVASNMLENGLFSAVTGAVPDGWVLNNATSALEATIYESGSRAISVTSAGASPRIQQDLLTANPSIVRQFAGGWVTLLVRVYVPSGAANGCGTIALRTDNGEYQSAPVGVNGVTGGFHWRVVSAYMRRSPTLMRVYLYADTASSTGQYAIFDRAILVRGLMAADSI